MAGKSKNEGNFLKQKLSKLLIFNSQEAIRDEIYYHDTRPNMFD